MIPEARALPRCVLITALMSAGGAAAQTLPAASLEVPSPRPVEMSGSDQEQLFGPDGPRLPMRRRGDAADSIGRADPAPSEDAPAALDPQGEFRLNVLAAQLRAQIGELPDARARFEALREARPESTEPLNGLAGIAQQTGRWRQALALYRDSLRLDAGDPSVSDAVAAIERGQASRVRTDLEYRQLEGGTGAGKTTAVIASIGGQQLLDNGWRLGLSLDLAHVDADRIQRANGTIESFSGLRQRGEIYAQHTELDGQVLIGSLFMSNSMPGVGFRWERPDDRGTTFLRAEYRRPNWDFLQSIVEEGTRDRLAVARSQRVGRDVSLRLEVAGNRYGIRGDGDVARTVTVTGEARFAGLAGLTGLSTAYVFDGEYLLEQSERFSPTGGRYAPLPILDREVHAAVLTYSGTWGNRIADGLLAYEASGGYGIDRYGKAGPLAYAAVGYNWDNLEIRIRANYVQDIGRTRGTSSGYGLSLTWVF